MDLQPAAPGVVESIAFDVSFNGIGPTTESGSTYFSAAEVPHASYWNGSGGSFQDLQSYLPAQYTSSLATGIFTNNLGTSFVVGYAFNSITGHNEPASPGSSYE